MRAIFAGAAYLHARSSRTSVRSLPRYAPVPGEAACSCATTTGLVRQRLICSGVEDQWLQLGAVHHRYHLAEHDQVITGTVRMLPPGFECRRSAGQQRAAGDAQFQGHLVEHRRAGRTVPICEPAADVLPQPRSPGRSPCRPGPPRSPGRARWLARRGSWLRRGRTPRSAAQTRRTRGFGSGPSPRSLAGRRSATQGRIPQ